MVPKISLLPWLDHVAEHALGVGGLGHVLDEAGRDLVAELLLDRLARLVVREGPAAVADRADVGERDLQRARRGPARLTRPQR